MRGRARISGRSNTNLRVFYKRQRHPSGKAAIAAVMRKLLLLVYRLFRN